MALPLDGEIAIAQSFQLLWKCTTDEMKWSRQKFLWHVVRSSLGGSISWIDYPSKCWFCRVVNLLWVRGDSARLDGCFREAESCARNESVGPFEQCSRGYRLDVCSLIATLQATFLERTDSRWYEIEPLVLLNNAHEVIDLMFVVPWPDWENRVVAPFDGLTRFECWFVSTLSMVIPLTWRDTQVVVAWSGESTI